MNSLIDFAWQPSVGFQNGWRREESSDLRVYEPLGKHGHVFLRLAPKTKAETRRIGIFSCSLCSTEFTELITVVRSGKRKSCGCLLKAKTEQHLTEKQCNKCNTIKPVAEFRFDKRRDRYDASCAECDRAREAELRRDKGIKEKIPTSFFVDLSVQHGIDITKRRLGTLCPKGHKWNGLEYSLRELDRGATGQCMECKRDRMYDYNRKPEVKAKLQKYADNYSYSRWLQSPRISPTVAALVDREQVRYTKQLEDSRARYQVNRDAVVERSRRRYQDNYEYELMRVRMYKHTNPHAHARHGDKRSALAAIQSDGSITKPFLKQLYSQAEVCPYCLAQYQLTGQLAKTLDHLIPLSRGGAHSKDNVIVCCRKCNTQKGDKTPDEYFSYLNPSWPQSLVG